LKEIPSWHLSSSEPGSVAQEPCPSNYYSLNVNGERNVNAAWYYAEPKDAASQIKGRVAFWKGVSVIA